MIPSVEYEQIDIGSGEKNKKIIVKTTCLGTDMGWFTKPNNFGVKISFSSSFFKINWPGKELGLKFKFIVLKVSFLKEKLNI